VASSKSDDESGVDLVAAPGSPPTPSEKKHFLDKEETWERARYLFPDLLKPNLHLSDPKVERVVSELLPQRLTELRKDEMRFARLTSVLLLV
jgi:hypothetical protein